MSPLDDTIWQHLADHHGAEDVHLPDVPSRTRRRAAMAAGVTAGVAAVATGTVLALSPATQPAYAMTRHSDGSVTVTIHDLATAIPALNAKFKALGIDETVVPVEAGCKDAAAAAGPIFGNDPMFADAGSTPQTTMTFGGGGHLTPGYHGVVAAEQLPDGQVAMAVEAVPYPLPTCFPDTVYSTSTVGTTTDGDPILEFTPTNGTTTGPATTVTEYPDTNPTRPGDTGNTGS